MSSRTKSHSYESLLLLVIVVAIVMSAFISAVHFNHIEVVDSIKRLLETLTTSNTN